MLKWFAYGTKSTSANSNFVTSSNTYKINVPTVISPFFADMDMTRIVKAIRPGSIFITYADKLLSTFKSGPWLNSINILNVLSTNSIAYPCFVALLKETVRLLLLSWVVALHRNSSIPLLLPIILRLLSFGIRFHSLFPCTTLVEQEKEQLFGLVSRSECSGSRMLGLPCPLVDYTYLS